MLGERGAVREDGVEAAGVTVRGSFEEGPWHGSMRGREGKVRTGSNDTAGRLAT